MRIHLRVSTKHTNKTFSFHDINFALIRIISDVHEAEKQFIKSGVRKHDSAGVAQASC